MKVAMLALAAGLGTVSLAAAQQGEVGARRPLVWPRSILCTVPFKKIFPDGTESKDFVGSEGVVADLSLAPARDGVTYYVHPSAGDVDHHPPKGKINKGYQDAMLGFTATGAPVGVAPGDCLGKSVQTLEASGQAR